MALPNMNGFAGLAQGLPVVTNALALMSTIGPKVKAGNVMVARATPFGSPDALTLRKRTWSVEPFTLEAAGQYPSPLGSLGKNGVPAAPENTLVKTPLVPWRTTWLRMSWKPGFARWWSALTWPR